MGTRGPMNSLSPDEDVPEGGQARPGAHPTAPLVSPSCSAGGVRSYPSGTTREARTSPARSHSRRAPPVPVADVAQARQPMPCGGVRSVTVGPLPPRTATGSAQKRRTTRTFAGIDSQYAGVRCRPPPRAIPSPSGPAGMTVLWGVPLIPGCGSTSSASVNTKNHKGEEAVLRSESNKQCSCLRDG